jgi:hypothetical protein
MSILHVIITVFGRAITLRRLIDCFVLQTNPNWVLHIIHDGPPPREIPAVMSLYHDFRIQYEETPQVNGNWGHPNRQIMLHKMVLNHRDFVLMTNDDNMYVPSFVGEFLKKARNGENVGMVYCDTMHSYMEYEILKTQLKENLIDMGSFIVRVDVAKKVGFTHIHFSADGTYAVNCAAQCRSGRLACLYIPKPLFIHC